MSRASVYRILGIAAGWKYRKSSNEKTVLIAVNTEFHYHNLVNINKDLLKWFRILKKCISWSIRVIPSYLNWEGLWVSSRVNEIIISNINKNWFSALDITTKNDITKHKINKENLHSLTYMKSLTRNVKKYLVF